MQIKPAIFVVTVILLVPFVYGISFLVDVSALPPSSGYTSSGTCGAKTTNSDGVSKQTCCWKQRTGSSAGPGPEVNVCQTCFQTSDVRAPLACNDPVVQSLKSPGTIPPLENGGVLDDPSTSPKLGGRLPPITGGNIIEEPNGSNATK